MSFATMIVLPIFEVIENPSYLDLTIPALKSTVKIATAKRVAFEISKRDLIFFFLLFVLFFPYILTEYFQAISLFGFQLKRSYGLF